MSIKSVLGPAWLFFFRPPNTDIANFSHRRVCFVQAENTLLFKGAENKIDPMARMDDMRVMSREDKLDEQGKANTLRLMSVEGKLIQALRKTGLALVRRRT